MTVLHDVNGLPGQSSYFNGIFFVFVPNVCDAACDFCYIRPLLGSGGHLAPGVLRRARSYMHAFRDLGFQEARFTGGEPLVFDNITSLFDVALDAGLDYTVLTNGINLHKHVPYLLHNPPSKVTVSVHTLQNIEAIFGVSRDVDLLCDSMQTLTSSGVAVAATIVLNSTALADLDSTLARLAIAGINEVKLVAPNVPGADAVTLSHQLQRSADRAFHHLGAKARVRYSSVTSRCLLKKEATISVQIPSGEIGLCCATVGDWEPLGSLVKSSLASLLKAAYHEGMAVGPLPCAAHYGACPISLESRNQGEGGGHVL